MKTWNFFVRVCIVVFGMLGTAAAALATPVVSSVSLQQINFASQASGPVANSEYGHFIVSYTADPTTVYFLNVVAKTGASPAGWVVQNLPLFDAANTGESSFSQSALVNLGTLGVTRGSARGGSTYNYNTVLSTAPLATMPTYTGTSSATFGTTEYSEGSTKTIVPDAAPALPPPGGPVKPAFVPGPVIYGWRTGLDNQDVGQDQCSPASLTISFRWLASKYPNSINLGNQTWRETLEKLKVDTKWAAPICGSPTGKDTSGCAYEEIIRGKMRFIQRADKTFAPGWKVKYQVAAGLIKGTPSSITEGNMTAAREGTGIPDFNFVLTQMRVGADVEVHVGWLDANGNRDGGHSMAVKGAVQIGNKRFIVTTDDADQDTACTRAGLPIPKANQQGNGGLRNMHINQVDLDANGYMVLSGEPPNRVEMVTIQQPPGTIKTPGAPVWALIVLGLLTLATGMVTIGRARRGPAAV